jgi:putative glutamine amidotransferase
MRLKDKDAIIGIPGWKTGENSFGVTLPYLEFFSDYGIVKILTLSEKVDNSIDLLVIPGGADIDPRRYGAIPSFKTSKPDLIKEYFDTNILPKYIENGTPVFGICRGLQSIAVMYGAQLIQHITHHETNEITDRSAGVHNLILIHNDFKERFKRECFSGKEPILKVNSMHHQCVSSVEIPECLDILGVSKGKSSSSSIEVIRHSELPIAAVQYHPEEMGFELVSDYLIQNLISKSKNYE